MATIKPTVTQTDDLSIKKVAYETITTTNGDGSPIPLGQYVDCSIQITGTLGGGSIVWQGSNDGGTTWATLDDVNGSALSVSSLGIEHCNTPVELARPLLSGGDGTTDLDVTVICRRANMMRQ